ncbi:amidohydrolase family protein [Paenibacillus sp. JSM ZJ436]|uniref:amidohydrolase family protein n=1 Tax=Paenibacillus sp. JSM ZJ436 TaxID=3376190 RepID=UPI0037AB2682
MMKLIDTHVHLGVSKFSGVATTEADIIDAMKKYNVETSLVMPQPTLEDIEEVHRRIARFSAAYPGKIYGMAAIDPWLDEERFDSQAQECFEQHHFVAIKLHPMGHNISPLSPRCDQIYAAARKYKVPVIVHTGIGNPFSLPSLMIEPARRFPDVPIILAHAGFAVYTDEAVVAAKACENIYLEPSWCPTYTIKKMVDHIGAERMMLGSDHISNLPIEILKLQTIGITEQQMEQILYSTPKQLFHIS